MNWLLIGSVTLFFSTFPLSLIMLALDWESVDFKLDWTPTWPYGFSQPKPDVDPDIVTHHLLENNNEIT